MKKEKTKMYDYLIVGVGLYGTVFAHEAKNGALYEKYKELAKKEL